MRPRHLLHERARASAAMAPRGRPGRSPRGRARGRPRAATSGSSCSQHSMSVKPAASRRARSPPAWRSACGPRRSSPMSDAGPPRWTRCSRRRRTGPRADHRARSTAARFGEQRVVIEDPVERGGGQDRVHRRDGQRPRQVRHDVLHAVRAQPLPGALDHGGGPVQGDDRALGAAGRAAARSPGRCRSPRPAPLATVQIQPVEHRLAPGGHRDRQAVVGGGVPFAGHRAEFTG